MSQSQENVVDLESNDDDMDDKPHVQRRKTRKRSIVWDHFTEFVNEKGETKASCKYCGKEYYSGGKTHGTSTLIHHASKCSSNPLNKENEDQTKLVFKGEGSDNERKLFAWKFDQQSIRKALTEMIILDKLPFRFVEGEGFKRFMSVSQPLFQIPSRFTIARDCLELFNEGKKKVCTLLHENTGRICLTTDTWTSIQRVNYMVLTAHFIDNDWNLTKKVINFCPITSHKGVDIGKAIEVCLLGWGIENVFTITVDNASANDVAIGYLKEKFENWGNCVLKAKWTHFRCVAHIMNLIVQDGLSHIGKSVDCVRAAVKYIRQSPSRLGRFKECAEMEKCESSKGLVLDVPTRWNSTYLMLETAQVYEKAFNRYNFENREFNEDLGKNGVPTSSDWKNVRKMAGFLKHFYDLTLKVSGTLYVTSHTFLDDITSIFVVLKKCLNDSGDKVLCEMAELMQSKFHKYYGGIEKFNMLVYVASILDPRNKLEYLEVLLLEVYGKVDGISTLGIVKDGIYELFEDYVRMHGPSKTQCSSENFDGSSLGKRPTPADAEPGMFIKENFRKKMKMKMGSRGVGETKSELDKYLNEEIEDDSPKFDILNWWKVNAPRFPVLSLVARDVLAIPISTVASESVFSTSGRVLDPFRSSLTPTMVESLVCSQNWIRGRHMEIEVEETWEEYNEIEKDVNKSKGKSNLPPRP